MNKLKNKLKMVLGWTIGSAFGLAFCSCSEDIDESNLYVSLEQTINDYLSENPEFSDFHYIIERSGYDKILSAYGEYTCFAPSNAGVAEYLDSLYNDTVNIVNPHNGMTAPGLEGLTDSLCLDIALFHLMSSKTIGIEMDKGNTLNTMINREIISSLGPDGEIILNGSSTITEMDIELQNGIVHAIDRVLKRSNALVAHELEMHEDVFSLFSQALHLCGLADTLTKQERKGLILPKKESNEYIPKECLLGYTILAETDDAFHQANIYNINQLIDSANVWYADCHPFYDYARQKGIEVSTGTDYRNPWNALNMFVRYHIFEVKVPFQKLYQREHGEAPEFEQVEYYETMLPYTLLKVSRLATQTVVNRWVENSSLTDRVAQLASAEIARVRRPGIVVSSEGYSCANGYIHPLTNGVLRYDDGVAHGALNERLRFDVMSILHETLSNNIRCATDAELRGFNGGITCSNGRFSGEGTVLLAENYCSGLRVYNGSQTMLFYLSGQGVSWQNYQGDEMNCVGAYDFALRLPPVPAGIYEVRMGYSANPNRGMMQIYIGNTSELADMMPVDIPLDMRREPSDNDTETNPNPYNGWCQWENCDDKGVASDVNMRYLGFMRAPLGCRLYNRADKSGTQSLRSCRQPLRRILFRQNFEQREYWLRFKTMIPENKGTQFHLEYLEIVPENVYNNAQYMEDMY